MAEELSASQAIDVIDNAYGHHGADFVAMAVEQVNRWLSRGDGMAVYRNADLGSPDAGDIKITSYGSPAAQLETDTPPEILPDMGGAINWRYVLESTYRGDPLPETDYADLDDDLPGPEEYDTSDPYDKEYDVP